MQTTPEERKMIPKSHSEAYELFETTDIARHGYATITIARYRSVEKHPIGVKQEAEHHYFNLLYQEGRKIRRIDSYEKAIAYIAWLFRRQTPPKPLKYVVKAAA